MSEATPTRITSITVQGFGPLRHFSQDIEELTVVFGRNESGKSSIVDAIYAWFRSKSKFRSRPIEVRTIKVKASKWDSNLCWRNHLIMG